MEGMASRVAWASIGVNILLSLLNLGLATASGSLAVTAEMIHNLVDLAVSVAVLAGVKISERKSSRPGRRFCLRLLQNRKTHRSHNVDASVILFDPIFQGLATLLMTGEVASLLLSRRADRCSTTRRRSAGIWMRWCAS